MGNWERLVWNQRDVLIQGLLVTIEICAIAFAAAIVMGLGLALIRLYVRPLRWIAGADARRHDRALARWAATRGDVSYVDIGLELNRGVMASDGFHPGEPVYRQCATMIAHHIAADIWPALPGDPT